MDASGLAEVTDGSVSHVMIEHPPFQHPCRVVVRIFVISAPSSGFAEIAPDGEVLAVR